MEAQRINELIKELLSRPVLNAESAKEFLKRGYLSRISFNEFFAKLRQHCSQTKQRKNLAELVIHDITQQLLTKYAAQNEIKRYFMLVANDLISQKDKMYAARYRSFVENYWPSKKEFEDTSALSETVSNQTEKNKSELAAETIYDDADSEGLSPEQDAQSISQGAAEGRQKLQTTDHQDQKLLQQYYQDLLLEQLEIPDFLWSEQRGVGLFKFLSFDTTNGFTEELQEVLDLLKEQVSQKGSYLLISTEKFVHSYQYYRIFRQLKSKSLIKSIKISEQSINSVSNNEFQTYQKHEDLLQNWTQHVENISSKFNETKVEVSWIKENMLKCLKKVILYYTPFLKAETEYGFSEKDCIYVNLNNINKGITLQQFKKGPLKAYLYVVILHEVGHMLIRRIQYLKLSDFDNSIDLEDKSQESQLVWNLLKKYWFDIIDLIGDCSLKTFDVSSFSQNHKKVNQKIAQWQEKYQNFESIRSALESNFETIEKTKKRLKCILILEENSLIFKHTSYLQKWTRFFDYMSSDKPKKAQDQKQKFISALYSGATIFPGSILNHDKYTEAAQLVIKQECYNLEERRSIFENVFKLAKGLYDGLSKSHLVQTFNELFLRPSPFEAILQQVRDAVQQVSSFENFKNIAVSTINTKTQNYYNIYQILGEWNESVGVSLKKLKDVIKVHNLHAEITRKLNLSPIYLIACRIPTDYMLKQFIKTFDTGYQLQTIVFPKLYKEQNSRVRLQDYALIKELNNYNAKQIGEAAQNKSPTDLLFARTKKSNTRCGIQLGHHCQRKRVRNWKFQTKKVIVPAKNTKKKFNRCIRPT